MENEKWKMGNGKWIIDNYFMTAQSLIADLIRDLLQI